MSLARNGDLPDSKFGLIVISHGTGGSDLGHRDLAVSLARAGFIVASVLHPRDNFRDSENSNARAVWDGRPKQISALINYFLTNTAWSHNVDPKKINGFGFSRDGYTMIALLGAKYDLNEVASHCLKHPEQDTFCNRYHVLDQGVIDNIRAEYPTLVDNFLDNRIKAMVTADPLVLVFSNLELNKVSDIPTLLYLPEIENELVAKFNGQRLAKLMQQRQRKHPASVVHISGAHHYSFLSPFSPQLAKQLTLLANDFNGFDRKHFHQQSSSQVTDFFRTNLP